MGVLGSLPTYTFYVILSGWFICEIVNDIAIKRTGKSILFKHEKVLHYACQALILTVWE